MSVALSALRQSREGEREEERERKRKEEGGGKGEREEKRKREREGREGASQLCQFPVSPRLCAARVVGAVLWVRREPEPP